ncbi:hypothetical protein M5X00_17800 [Paenibacillus alvei]|uniref:hypothetical protein n=1 Tax=Paenibacillus alvei TaxID=44250 RepID=UPI0021CF9D53|nr:hypothetical protein [Paenibacillus alvei]MCY9544218.1 hypothetical protein [Paenibacillus alvei]MCY9708741.1 hypothetical protein [Paenibacillus alvei]MCY9756095.1 hypothetical protein [Paenibacillus alvei]MEC0084646.1 hypothetical protein [Paenibacillus alvei]
MEFKVQRNDRRTAVGGDWTITIEGEDLKEAVTQNISRISYVSDYYGDSIVLPANAKVSWYPSSAGLTKKFKMWPDGTTREYTEEEYEADSGFISLTLVGSVGTRQSSAKSRFMEKNLMYKALNRG